MRMAFSFDTEDFVTPETDDALKALAQTASRLGVRICFALVGDKARALWTRGRRDVIEAVKAHEVHYHSNTHMFWPNTSRVLAGMTWDEGLDFVLHHERHGVEDVAEVFGRRPVAWIRPDGNQAPQEIYAMRLLGMEMFLPCSYLPRAGGLIWYMNMLLGPYNFPFDRYLRAGQTAADMERDFLALKKKVAGTGTPLVMGSHPCKYTTDTFYDVHNIRPKGNIPPKAKWVPPPVVAPAELRRRVRVFEALLKLARRQRDVELVTLTDLVALHREASRWISAAQLRRAAAAARRRFDYQRLGAGWLSAADICGAMSLALTHWQAAGALPTRVPVRRVLGPPEPARTLATPRRSTARQVAAACAQIEREIDVHHRLPSQVLLDGRRVPPTTFFMAMADALEQAAGRRAGAVRLRPQPAHPRCQRELFADVRIGAHSLPEGFDPGRIRTYTWQQSWSARPAVGGQA
ncbi:MAG: hypothetical protein JXR37_28745 [Kiritimatiellae bacterium]|nr:hypothetical protein [Kiritimatiellia bacterium]